MSNNSDSMFEKYADMDFTDAKPVSEVPALANLQALRQFAEGQTLAEVVRETIRQELHQQG
jgi:hypothetical protein